MDDRKLEVFLAAVEEGSFNKAAKRCYCSQSAVSQIVNALEAELGCKVVARTHSGVSPTDAGLKLIPLAREAHAALQRLRHAAAHLSCEGAPLRIGAYSSIASTWLPKALVAFQDVQPQASFSTQIGSADLAALLRDGLIDVALCDDWLFREELLSPDGRGGHAPHGKTGSSGFSWTPLVDDPLRAVVPRSLDSASRKAITREELRAHPFVYVSEFVYGRRFAREAESVVTLSADDGSSVLSMVASGLGVSVLPALSLSHVPADVAVLDLDPPEKRMVGAALGPDAPATARAFATFLAQAQRRAAQQGQPSEWSAWQSGRPCPPQALSAGRWARTRAPACACSCTRGG